MKKFTIFIIAIILFLIVQCVFYGNNCEAQWIQQTLPVSGTIYQMQFINQNTGWINFVYPDHFIKTTNGGTNWTVLFDSLNPVGNFYFFNDTLGYYSISRTYAYFYKTTNGGVNWQMVSSSASQSWGEFSFVSKDTGWMCGYNGFNGTILKTTNGGITFTTQYTTPYGGLDKIQFLKNKVNGENVGWFSASSFLQKTTNSGINWTQISTLPKPTVTKMYFINQDTGWFNEYGSGGGIFRTTNGGINWIQQSMPNLPQVLNNDINDFCFVNKDFGWGVGGSVWFGGNRYFGIVWATTNGGINWGYQLPDTNMIYVNGYSKVFFFDKYNGWAETGGPGIRTTVGGGPIIYTGISNINLQVPKYFVLYQNYPNPFNPVSSIQYQVTRNSNVKLVVYNIAGKEITTLVNEKKYSGTYQALLDGNNLSSGVYLYTLFIDGKIIDTKKAILIK